MKVSRSGYYKWKKRPPTQRDINREKMIELVKSTHEEHRTHGYCSTHKNYTPTYKQQKIGDF